MKKHDNKECSQVNVCPIALKCLHQGVYLRKYTDKCPCRDWVKEFENRHTDTNAK